MAEPSVLYQTREGVATITLNRPRVLNALDLTLSAQLADAADAAARDRDVWVVVVRGAGRAFCSGMDRTLLSAGGIDEAFYRNWIRALNRLEDMDPLVVAVLHGYSIGGGLQLASACDVRVATTDAVLGLGATRHGLIPDGSILRLARIVGLGRAKELTLLNDNVTPQAALAMGLVNWVVEPSEVDDAIGRVVQKACHSSRTANGHAKRLLNASFHRDPREMIEEIVRTQNECMASWEMDIANRAWDERREARFYPRPGSTPGAARPPSGPGPR